MMHIEFLQDAVKYNQLVVLKIIAGHLRAPTKLSPVSSFLRSGKGTIF